MVFDESIDDEINELGTNVVVYSETTQFYDDWGNKTQSSTSKTMKVVLNDITGEEAWNTEGIFVSGDKVLFLKSPDTMTAEDIVFIDPDWYRVVGKPIRHNVQGANQQKEVKCKRINTNASSIDYVI